MDNLQTRLQTKHGVGLFSGSTLKIIACIFMAIDHIGAHLFPYMIELRIMGRIAFPIFAYFIAEGCIYTKNKPKRLITILAFGLVCESVYYFYTGSLYGNILLTFSVSVFVIYCMQELKKILAEKNIYKSIVATGVFAIILLAVYKLNSVVGFDYGFTGIMVPVFAAVFDDKDRKDLRFMAFCIGLMFVILRSGIYNIQVWSLMAVPLVALYNGEPGVRKLKYGFYIFYPLHLALIELVAVIMQNV